MENIQATPFVPGQTQGLLRHGVAGLDGDCIAVVDQEELTKLEKRPAAVIGVDTAPLSHPMIRLLGLGIPTVMISAEQARSLPEGARVFVDGSRGTVQSQAPPKMAPVLTESRPGQPVYTADGVAVELRASVGTLDSAKLTIKNGASAVGLVRSEYLYPANGSPPDEAYFEHAVRSICQTVHPLPVTVRLLDIAPDKRPGWVRADLFGPLGLRGLRLYGEPIVHDVLLGQISAIGHLAREFDLSILVPYVTSLEEFEYLRRLVEDHLPVPMQVGAMLETSAGVWAMKEFMELTDMVAIGCNDLMQSLFAADRDVPALGRLLSPNSPVIFRVLRQIAQAMKGETGRIQLCGLLPQLPHVLPLLLGLGYRTFSVEPVLLSSLAEIVAASDCEQAEALAIGVCAAPDTLSVRTLLNLSGTIGWPLAGLHR